MMIKTLVKIILFLLSLNGNNKKDSQRNPRYINTKTLEETKNYINNLENINKIAEKEIIIIIPSYNNEKWVSRNLESVFSQKYNNYKVVYRDDCSTDKTYDCVMDYVNKNNLQDKIIVKRNENKKCKASNLLLTIYSLDINYEIKDDSIILILDGDDHLAHEYIFKYVNWLFHKDVWLTYGGYVEYPSMLKGGDESIPEKNIIENKFRKSHLVIGSHLRTFYAGLFKKIKFVDFFYEGKFVPMATDITKMMPMFEMSGDHTFHISKPVYFYNRENPINEDKVDSNLQFNVDTFIQSKKSYKRLNSIKDIFSIKEFKTDLLLFSKNCNTTENFFSSNYDFIKKFNKIVIIAENIDLSLENYKLKNLEVPIVKLNFKNSLLSILNNCSEYLFICKDDSNINNKTNIKLATEMLKKTKAAGFYFNIKKENLPKIEMLNNNIAAWQFKYSINEEFRKSYTIDSVIYKKNYFIKKLEKINFNSIDELELGFKELNNNNLSNNIGLFLID